MERFNVLPTDPRLLSLTDEQVVWIFNQQKIDDREAKERAQKFDETFHDPEYEEWEERVIREEEGFYPEPERDGWEDAYN